MSLIERFVILGMLCLTATPVAAAEVQGAPNKEIIAVLDKARANDYPGVLDRIDILHKRGKKADAILVRLLDYYVGEGPSLILDEAITRRGKRMLKPLLALKAQPLDCFSEYMQVCMSRFKNGDSLRNENIDRLVAAISKGVVLRAEK